MVEKQDIAAMLEDPAVARAGMQLIAENWSPRQQWGGTPLNKDPVSTTIGLGSLVFKEQVPDDVMIHTMLNAATGHDGYAARVTNDQGEPIVATQPLWQLEFDSVDAREAFVDRLAQFKAEQKGTVVDPKQLAAMAAPGMQESITR